MVNCRIPGQTVLLDEFFNGISYIWYSSGGFGGTGMKRFVEGQDRSQLILLPDCLDGYVGEDNPVRIVDAFIDELVWRCWVLRAFDRKRPAVPRTIQ